MCKSVNSIFFLLHILDIACNIAMKCIYVHRMFIMFINIYRNPKIRNWFRYESFIYFFGFKLFRHEERETHFLSMMAFPFAPNTCGTFRRPPTGLVSARSKNQLAPSKSETQLQLTQPTRGHPVDPNWSRLGELRKSTLSFGV